MDHGTMDHGSHTTTSAMPTSTDSMDMGDMDHSSHGGGGACEVSVRPSIASLTKPPSPIPPPCPRPRETSRNTHNRTLNTECTGTEKEPKR